MKIKRIEHVAIYVKDTAASRFLWEECLGLTLTEAYTAPEPQAKVAMYPVGETLVELISGSGPESRFTKMVEDGKAGINHIAFEVEDLDTTIAELAAKGIGLDETNGKGPQPGHGGSRIVFLDMAKTENCRIELCEMPKDGYKSEGIQLD